MLMSKYPIQYVGFETPVGVFDDLANAIYEMRKAGIDMYKGRVVAGEPNTGNCHVVFLDRPVTENTRRAGIKKSGKRGR